MHKQSIKIILIVALATINWQQPTLLAAPPFIATTAMFSRNIYKRQLPSLIIAYEREELCIESYSMLVSEQQRWIECI